MIELIDKRTKNSKTHDLGNGKSAWDGSTSSVHYWDNGWKNIDTILEPAQAPWDWQMLNAGYHIRVKEDFASGQIMEFEKRGETAYFQPMALEWTNDLDQIQSISMPQDVIPVITNPTVELLPDVPSHQGIIRWDNAYGWGIDFQWSCSPTRLVKTVRVDAFSSLPPPQQYIMDGGNPVLRLNIIFDPSNDLDILVDGNAWNKRDKVQTFSTIKFSLGNEVLWGFAPLKYWGSDRGVDSWETNQGQSVATLEKRGNSLYISIRVPYEWLQSAVYPIYFDTDVDEQIGATDDDAREYYKTTGGARDVCITDGTTLSPGYATNWVGWRFQTVNVAKDTSCTVGYLSLCGYGINNGETHPITLQGEDIDDAPAFVAGDPSTNISGRTLTTASTAWTVAESWDDGTWYNSDSIVDILDEIFARGGWAANQDLVIIAIELGETSYRTCYAWDGDNTKGAKLHIEYGEAAAAGIGASSVIINPWGITEYGGEIG